MSNAHQVVLNGLVMSEAAPIEQAGCLFYVHGEDLDFGNPVPVEVVLSSLVRDGSLVRKVRDDNREMALSVSIEAPDSSVLADGEALLALATGRPGELSWTPPDGWGATTVFDVQTSQADFVTDDMAEVLQKRRTYRLRVVALPYGRAVEPVTVEFAAGGASTLLDSCDSLAGWSGPTAIDTVHKVQGTGSLTLTTLLTGTTPWGAPIFQASFAKALVTSDRYVTAYVRAQVAGGGGLPTHSTQFAASAAWGGAGWQQVERTLIDDSFFRVTFDRGPNAGPTSQIIFTAQATPGSALMFLEVKFNLDAISTSSGYGGGRQSMRSSQIQGSVATPGSLALSTTEPDGLGEVILWSGEDRGDGYTPNMMQWRNNAASTSTRSGTVIDSSFSGRVSGHGIDRLDIPASMLAEGTYLILVAGSGEMVMSAHAWLALPNGEPVAHTPTIKSAMSSGIGAIGTLELPPASAAKGSAAKVVLNIDHPTSDLDEVWLLRMLPGDATIRVSAGARKRMWVRQPSIEHPRGRIEIGDSETGMDAYSAGANVHARDMLHLPPPRASVFVAGAPNTSTSFTYHPAGITHAPTVRP